MNRGVFLSGALRKKCLYSNDSCCCYLKEEDYPGAIQLCLECQKAASTFKHYSCIR